MMGIKQGVAIIHRLVDFVIRGITVFNLIAIIVLVGLQVISRFARGFLPSMPDEMVSLNVVWMVFLAAALLCKEDEHLRIEWVETLLRRGKVLYYLTRAGLELCFVGFFFYSALRLYRVSYRAVTHTLLLPVRWWYLSLLVSGGLMAVYIARNAFRNILHKKGG